MKHLIKRLELIQEEKETKKLVKDLKKGDKFFFLGNEMMNSGVRKAVVNTVVSVKPKKVAGKGMLVVSFEDPDGNEDKGVFNADSSVSISEETDDIKECSTGGVMKILIERLEKLQEDASKDRFLLGLITDLLGKTATLDDISSLEYSVEKNGVYIKSTGGKLGKSEGPIRDELDDVSFRAFGKWLADNGAKKSSKRWDIK